MKGLEFLELPSPEPECVKPDNLELVFITLKVFSFWLYQTHTSVSGGPRRPQASSLDSDCETRFSV